VRTVHTTTDIEDDEIVQIKTYKRGSWIINFRPLGIVNSRQPESMDSFEYICEFTKGELFLLREVYRHTDKDNNCLTLRLKTYTSADQAKLKNVIPLWIKKGLLKRIKQEYYMVNPWFLPPREEHMKAMNCWKALK